MPDDRPTPWFTDLLRQLATFSGVPDPAQAYLGTPALTPEQTPLPLHQATMPLQGFLGPKTPPATPDNRYGGFATWMNLTGGPPAGLNWLFPSLTPNQDPEDVRGMLRDDPALRRGHPMEDQARTRQIADLAAQFAQQMERSTPGTFAKYPTSVEALAAALGASKNLFYRQPATQPQYPGR